VSGWKDVLTRAPTAIRDAILILSSLLIACSMNLIDPLDGINLPSLPGEIAAERDMWK